MMPFGIVSFLATRYQLAQFISKIGSVLAEMVGQCTALADSAWWPLQLPVEKPWSMPGGPFVCLFAKSGVKMLFSPCTDSISGILGSL